MISPLAVAVGDDGVHVLLVFGQKSFSVVQLTCDGTSHPPTAEPRPPTIEPHLPTDETRQHHAAESHPSTAEPYPPTEQTHPPIAEAQYRLSTVVRPVELSDWILDAEWLMYRDPSSFSVAFMTAHNAVLVYSMTPESTSIRTYLCEVNCILYPKKILVTHFCC